MEANTSKRKTHAIADDPVSSSQTATKDAPEAVACASSKEAADVVTPASGAASATKKVKREEEKTAGNAPKEPKEELILEWVSYGDDDDVTTHTVSVDELIQNRMTLADCREAMENEKDDCHNRDFQLKLVLRQPPSPIKQEESTKAIKVLASLRFAWWEDSAKASLMHFNIMSKFVEDFICACNF